MNKRLMVLAIVVGWCLVGLVWGAEFLPVADTTVTATADTNRVSGTYVVKSDLSEQSRNRFSGAGGCIYVSDISNVGDAAFGNIDTAILTYTGTWGSRSITFLTDTLAPLPATSQYYNAWDSLWKIMDSFYVSYYVADSTEDYAGSDDILVCTLIHTGRLITE